MGYKLLDYTPQVSEHKIRGNGTLIENEIP